MRFGFGCGVRSGLAIALFSLGFATHGFAASNVCLGPIRFALEKLSLVHPWKGFVLSDPRNHRAEKTFRYLVHTVTTRKALNGVDLIKNPELIREVPVLSSSLISEAKTMTYGNSGVIFEVPPERIYMTAPRDAGIDNEDGFRALKLYRSMYGLDSPESLLRKTSFYRYNEVVVLGKLEKTDGILAPKVTAYFVKVDRNRKPLCSPERYRDILQYAQKNGLPVVQIQENERVPSGDGPNDLVLDH